MKIEKTLIELKNVSKIYGKGRTAVKALSNINLKVKEGEFLAIIGPSGSGKTTLLNIMGALDKPTSGEVFIDNINISKIKESNLYKVRREKVGFIFQSYYLIPTLTALQNVLVPTFPLRNNKKKFLKRAKLLFKEVGLLGKEERRPSELSGGEQQRVAIARSLILDPPLILADEPTGNLDSKRGLAIINLMKRLNKKENKTFVIVTHNFQIAKICDRIIKLEDGKIKN
jgi:ABC-type lipoprotein export system ATPase subunit